MKNEYERIYPQMFDTEIPNTKKSMNNLPVFKFALREDVVEDKRFLPTKAEPLATGYDVRACPADRCDIVLKAGQYFKIPLGFRCFCPPGYYYQLHPRSSSFAKKHMHNLIGIIDESWEGETVLAGQFIPDAKSLKNELIIKFGDPVGQIIPIKKMDLEIVDVSNKELDDLFRERGASRKSGGFGSTDFK